MLPAVLGHLEANDVTGIDKEASGTPELFARECRLLGCGLGLADRLVRVRRQGKTRLLFGSETSFTSRTGGRLLRDKAMTHEALTEAGLRVARGRAFSLRDRARARARDGWRSPQSNRLTGIRVGGRNDDGVFARQLRLQFARALPGHRGTAVQPAGPAEASQGHDGGERPVAALSHRL